MGMHIDYGGMPSVRLAVRGADTLTLARANKSDVVRLCSHLYYGGEKVNRFEPFELRLSKIAPTANVGTREALMAYAGMVCRRRLEQTGSAQNDHWSVLVMGQLVYLESYFRARIALGGFDALVWSNVSPSGGMSSSSALVVSTACAALGANDLEPGLDLPMADLVDGVGTSEWIRGTRGGTADHGGMVMGRSGKLVGVGVFPAQPVGEAVLPEDYVALALDTGVPRIYDEAVKEETVVVYPLGTFYVRELLLPRLAGEGEFAGLASDFKERIHMIRDISSEQLGIGTAAIYRLLCEMPAQTSLQQLRSEAERAGCGPAFAATCAREITGKFQVLGDSTPIFLRRRFAFGLAEQDRVKYMLEYLRVGDMATVLELARISHAGDADQEVEADLLHDLRRRAQAGEERARLCFLPGGYGRMTPEYDRVVRRVNEYLLQSGGKEAGALQRLGAGWGGNMGGLIRREYIYGERHADFARFLRDELGIEADLSASVAAPGEGAGLVPYREDQ
jgi:galactokinase